MMLDVPILVSTASTQVVMTRPDAGPGHVLLSAGQDPKQAIFRKVRGYVSCLSSLIAPFRYLIPDCHHSGYSHP